MPTVSPELAAWQIGVRLRKAREAASLTTTEAALAIGISQNYVSNFEHGRRRISEDKIRLLAWAYEMDAGERDGLIELRAAFDQRGWWQRYNGILSADFVRFLGYEQSASHVNTYGGGLISGLLQTEAYARAIFHGDPANVRRAEVEQRLEVRKKRQELLSGPEPLSATIVMSEATLHQQVGGKAVLAEQLQHLLKITELFQDTVQVRIVPFTADSHGALSHSTFHILAFPNPDLPRLAWHEHGVGLDLVDDQPRVHQYSATFDEVLTFALGADESRSLIEGALRRLT
ncbi:helix-turn-helix transcriptional regulator [Salinifilum aidingensis]